MHSSFSVGLYIISHFSNGSKEVHIVFDNPGRLPDLPKAFERKRRDDAATLSSDHVHVAFSDTCTVPSNWRDCLSCRQCKRTLVLYLGQSFKNITESTCRLKPRLHVALITRVGIRIKLIWIRVNALTHL